MFNVMKLFSKLIFTSAFLLGGLFVAESQAASFEQHEAMTEI